MKEFVLSNGVKAPALAYGTWLIKNENAANCVKMAFEAGYRHIDTAVIYGNEIEVGQGVKESGIKREDIFITTKLPADKKGYDVAIECFNTSCKNLGVDYLDLYLIHAPWPWSNIGQDCTEGNIESWKAMVDLYNQGKIRAIGVSNFHPENIEPLIKATNVKPMVNQIRFFLGNTQPKVTNYCQDNNILVEAYSPLATGKMLNNPTLIEVANKYNVSPAKICLRYCLEKKTLPLPKSIHEKRIIDNLALDFDIDKDDIIKLDGVHEESLDKPLRS